METIGTSTGSLATGSASDTNAGPTYEEDSASRHFATTASQVPVPTGSLPPAPAATNTPSLDMNVKDVKNHGTRFHEDIHDTDLPSSPRLRSSRLFKGKGKEPLLTTSLEAEQPPPKKPLQLLDLPIDILKDIVKEVTHTNDLTSLALCHSALHQLTTPHIYSRFDIVWPDTNTHAEPRSGVDALTYGLATLVMAEEIFGEAPPQRARSAVVNRFNPSSREGGRASDKMIRRRKGNHYAQFTRKFSLGNGPADWVQEYLITKEGGKMLGTLVALAVARMRTLETFIWDMPTGILRDVWLALSSLGDRDDGRPCRLEKVWVRWHDNSSADTTNSLPPPPPPALNASLATAPSLHAISHSLAPPTIPPAALDRVEHPSFSVLPPLKSLSVLDIDELAYLDEMAVLIGRSLDKLRELRVGIARHAMGRDWVTVWEGDQLQQVDADQPTVGSFTIGEKRLGGVMGVLTGFVCDLRKPKVNLPLRTKRRNVARAKYPAFQPAVDHVANVDVEAEEFRAPTPEVASSSAELTSLRDMIPGVPAEEAAEEPAEEQSRMVYDAALVGRDSSDKPPPDDLMTAQNDHHPDSNPTETDEHGEAGSAQAFSIEGKNPAVEDLESEEYQVEAKHIYLENKLHLDSLELERVPLSIPLLQKAIDWTILTSLTLLHCQNHEQLWKTLRRTFAPTPRSPAYPHPRRMTPTSTPRKSSGKHTYTGSDLELDYPLKLKKIHTNTVSPTLISFLKDTLAPNSLETLFLQETRSYNSPVTVEQIYKGPLRRHRNSLKKVLIDSSEKGVDGLPSMESSRWRRWVVGRDVLGFMCGGKMPALRELGVAVDYKDWHFFLQHLPSVPHLRSLSIPFLADHVHGADVDPRELALQLVDIVALRPEVELCYMGIANKCFEILECRRSGSDTFDARSESRLGIGGGHVDDEEGAVASDPEVEDDDGEAGDDDADAEDSGDVEDEDAGTDSEGDDDEASDDESEGETEVRGALRLRLREILFYDDKVAIFKARHGRL